MKDSWQFSSTIHIPKKPNLELEIIPIPKHDTKKISSLVTEIFCKYEPPTNAIDCTEEVILTQDLGPLCNRTTDQGLTMVAYDKSNGNFVCTIWAEDQYLMESLPEDDGPIDEGIKELYSFLEHVEEKAFSLINKPNKQNENIHVMIVALNQEYSGLDITTEVMKFFMFYHPIGKNAKVFFAEASNSRSRKMFEKCGFKTLFSYKYDDLKSERRFGRIAKVDQSLGKELDFVAWERKP